MRDSQETFLSNKTRRALFVPAVFILIYLVSFIIDPYAAWWKNYFQRSYLDLGAEWIATFLFCILVTEATLLIHSRLNKKLPWTRQPVKRLFIETGLNVSVVLGFLGMNVLCVYLIYTKNDSYVLSIEDVTGLIQWLMVSIAITLMLMGVNTGSFIINNWKNSELEVAEQKLRISELRQASVEAELNALKLQLDPHFIFNNLSVLSELILENQKLGYSYAENFTKVYRYLLINSKKDLIPLSEEVKFLQSYIFLMEHRFGNGVQFDIKIDQHLHKQLIPPLSLQLLIENAIKHNITSKANPLIIQIRGVSDNSIVVENKICPIMHPLPESTGIGLANLTRRFNLLAEIPPVISLEDGNFKVIIQLIHYD